MTRTDEIIEMKRLRDSYFERAAVALSKWVHSMSLQAWRHYLDTSLVDPMSYSDAFELFLCEIHNYEDWSMAERYHHLSVKVQMMEIAEREYKRHVRALSR